MISFYEHFGWATPHMLNNPQFVEHLKGLSDNSLQKCQNSDDLTDYSRDMLLKQFELHRQIIPGAMNFFDRDSLLRLLSPLDPSFDTEDAEEKAIRLQREGMTKENLASELEQMFTKSQMENPLSFGIPTFANMADLSVKDLEKFAQIFGIDRKEFGYADFRVELYRVIREFVLGFSSNHLKYMQMEFRSGINRYLLPCR